MNTDLIGAITAVYIYLTSIAVFAGRMAGATRLSYWFGVAFLLSGLPVAFLIITAHGLNPQPLYYVQTGLMALFILVTLIVDYIAGFDFRKELKWVIPYVMLYFAGSGGMIGVASRAGRPWTAVCGVLFIISGGLAFAQRAKTGL